MPRAVSGDCERGGEGHVGSLDFQRGGWKKAQCRHLKTEFHGCTGAHWSVSEELEGRCPVACHAP